MVNLFDKDAKKHLSLHPYRATDLIEHHLIFERMAAKKTKYYVVWKGLNPGIYFSWEACSQQVSGVAGARYKSFPTKAEAEFALNQNPEFSISGNIKKKSKSTEKKKTGTPLSICIVVDAAWNSVQKDMEYQGIFFHTGKRIFHHGPLPNGTNNIGEFLAIVHALAYCKKQGLADMPIYSDSRNAIGWVHQKKCKTNLIRSPKTKLIFDLIDRAEHWLASHTFKNPILKWETEDWGENPADFGRK
jgi:ribonuclease HI